MKFRIMLVAFIMGVASIAGAQTPAGGVIDPNTITFVPSPDHSGVLLTGAPTVTNYEVVASGMNGNGAIVVTIGLGKPAPIAGLISVPQNLFNNLMGQLSGNLWYTAIVNAVGPDGVGASVPSNPFAKKVAQKPLPATAVTAK